MSLGRASAFLLLLLVLFSLYYMAPVSACTCIPPGPVAESLEEADSAFTGLATARVEPLVGESSADLVTIRFHVYDVYKGDVPADAELRTARSSASCGYPFKEGEEYLVYAFEDEGLEVHLCSKTKPMGEAQSELVEIQRLINPQTPSGGQPGNEETDQRHGHVEELVLAGGLLSLATVALAALAYSKRWLR